MRRTSSWLLLVLILLTVASCGRREPTSAETTLTAVGQAAPGFELVTLDGERFRLDEQRGKVVVVNFFATWCPPCREELPHLEKDVWQRFAGDDFALIVAGREEDAETLAAFRTETGFTFPIAPDPERAVFARYATQFIPRTVVVGRDGAILYQSSGYEPEEFARMVELLERELGR